MAKKAKKAPKKKIRVGYVNVDCATSEVMLAVRAYLGGVKTGLGPRKDKEAVERRRLIKDQEKKLGSMEKTLEAAEDQSQSVTVIFTKFLNKRLARSGAKPLV